MKKLLPILRYYLPTLFLLGFFCFSLFIVPQTIFAQQQGDWVSDAEVTFVGKVGARSGEFLNWALSGYQWTTSSDTLSAFWATIRNIVYIFFALFILASAFIMIVTRGKSITLWRFLRRFVLILIFVTLSFSIIQILYQITDIIQGIFLRNPTGQIIKDSDLLAISFPYQAFEGFRRFGTQFDESAFISLLLVKLTAITYYTMAGVLLLRKIILWFFIIISPIFPLLLFYYPIRNTAKIWIGEFFRWLFYAPIFAIFLSGLVRLWVASSQSASGIPVGFNFQNVGTNIIYPTAINILLAGPGQQIVFAAGRSNSLNTPDTFALYIVALLMLWVVIILPWILLQIFLDYLQTVSIGENTWIKQIMNTGSSFLPKPSPPQAAPVPPPPGPAPVPPPISSAPAGIARPLPFSAKISIPELRQTQIVQPVHTTNDVMRLTNLTIPTMRDVARYEISSLSKDVIRQTEVSHVKETLTKIANPAAIPDSAQRQQYTKVREQLLSAKEKGQPAASSVLEAAKAAQKQKQAGQIGGGATSEQMPGGAPVAELPAVNRVQAVSLTDYEAVKKMWEENYQKSEPPMQQNRTQWVKKDAAEITKAITLLTSNDQVQVKEGMSMVSKILPILLIGGFSQTEVIAYLKAKLEAAKTVMDQAAQKEQEEETMLDVEKREEQKLKEMKVEEEAVFEEADKNPANKQEGEEQKHE